jgi:excisionase family DNA binding protein
VTWCRPRIAYLGTDRAADDATFGAPLARLATRAEEWIGPAEVAARLKVSRVTVYALVKSGQLRYRRVGLHIAILVSALDDFLAGSR